jgi:hypothetical protein
MQARQQAVEGDAAGAAPEDAVEAGAQLGSALAARVALVCLEIGVEPPGQLAHQLDRQPLVVVAGDQLVHQPLGLDPAERVPTDSELAGVVGDDGRVLEQAVTSDAAPERACGGDLDRAALRGDHRRSPLRASRGGDLQLGDGEAIEMRQPSRFIGQALDRVRRELVDHRAGEVVVTHVGARPR